MFAYKLMLIRMSKMAHFIYFLLNTEKTDPVWARYLTASERTYLALWCFYPHYFMNSYVQSLLNIQLSARTRWNLPHVLKYIAQTVTNVLLLLGENKKKSHFWHFKGHNSGSKHDNYTDDQFFSIFFFDFKTIKIQFSGIPPFALSSVL